MKFGGYNPWNLDQGSVNNVEVSVNNAITLSTLGGTYEYVPLTPYKITATSEYSRFYSANNLNGSNAIASLSWKSWFSNKKPTKQEPQEIFYEYNDGIRTNKLRFFYCDNFQRRQPKDYSIWYSSDKTIWLPVENLTNGLTTESGEVIEQSFNSSGIPSEVIDNYVFDNQNNALGGSNPLWVTHCFKTVTARYFKLMITDYGGGETYISDDIFSEFVGISKLFLYSTEVSMNGSRKYNLDGDFTSPIAITPRITNISCKAIIPQQCEFELHYRTCKQFENITERDWVRVNNLFSPVATELFDLDYPDWKFQYKFILRTNSENFSPQILSLSAREVEKITVSSVFILGEVSEIKKETEQKPRKSIETIIIKPKRTLKEYKLTKKTKFESILNKNEILSQDLIKKQNDLNKKEDVKILRAIKNKKIKNKKVFSEKKHKNIKVESSLESKNIKVNKNIEHQINRVKKIIENKNNRIEGINKGDIYGVIDSKINEINKVQKALAKKNVSVLKSGLVGIDSARGTYRNYTNGNLTNENISIDKVNAPLLRASVNSSRAAKNISITNKIGSKNLNLSGAMALRSAGIESATNARLFNINEAKALKNANIESALSADLFNTSTFQAASDMSIKNLVDNRLINLKSFIEEDVLTTRRLSKINNEFKITKSDKRYEFGISFLEKYMVQSQKPIKKFLTSLQKPANVSINLAIKNIRSDTNSIFQFQNKNEPFGLDKLELKNELFNLDKPELKNELFNLDKPELKNELFGLKELKEKNNNVNILMTGLFEDYLIKKSKIIKAKNINTSPKIISKSFYIKPKLDEYIPEPYSDVGTIISVQGYTREIESPSRSEGGLEVTLKYPYLPETWDGISHIGLLIQHDRADIKTFKDNVSVLWEPIKQDVVITEKWSGMDYNFFYQLWLFYSMQKKCKYRPKDLNNHQYLVEIIGIEKGEQNRFWVKDVTLKMKVLTQIENWDGAESINRIPEVLPKPIPPSPDNLVE